MTQQSLFDATPRDANFRMELFSGGPECETCKHFLPWGPTIDDESRCELHDRQADHCYTCDLHERALVKT